MAIISVDPQSIPSIVNSASPRLNQDAANSILFSSYFDLQSERHFTALLMRATSETLSVSSRSVSSRSVSSRSVNSATESLGHLVPGDIAKGGAQRFDIFLLDTDLGEPTEWSNASAEEIVGQALLSWSDSADRARRIVQLDFAVSSAEKAPWDVLITRISERAHRVGADQFLVTSESTAIARACQQLSMTPSGYPLSKDTWASQLSDR